MTSQEKNSLIIKRQNNVLNSETTLEDEKELRVEIRPRFFSEYPGQKHVKENLNVYVKMVFMMMDLMNYAQLATIIAPNVLGKYSLIQIVKEQPK